MTKMPPLRQARALVLSAALLAVSAARVSSAQQVLPPRCNPETGVERCLLLVADLRKRGCAVSLAPGGGGHRRQTQAFGVAVLPLATSAGNPACWSYLGPGYTAARCCDVQQFANGQGDMRCWYGSYDFEFCCPAARTATTDPGCSGVDVKGRLADVAAACCDGSGECDIGLPTTCRPECGVVVRRPDNSL